MTYNGWENYETWCVNLHLNNDCGTYDYWIEEAYRLLSVDSPEDAAYELAAAIKDSLEEFAPTASEEYRRQYGECDVYTDLLGAAISEVNCNQIAKGFVDAAREEYAGELAEFDTEGAGQ